MDRADLQWSNAALELAAGTQMVDVAPVLTKIESGDVKLKQ